MVARLIRTLHRYRLVIAGVWLLHTFFIHLLLIGFLSWDGFAYRVPPEIELVQHGSFGFEKYDQWAFKGYVPFLELVHVPFVAVFKLAGIIVGFPLLVFPLCVWAIYLFVRQLTGEPLCGTFGALAYAAIPAINQQPYSGYIDFAVVGLFAFFLYALCRAADDLTHPPVPARLRMSAPLLRVALATLALTLARTTSLFLVGVILPFVMYAFCFAASSERAKFASVGERWRCYVQLFREKRRLLLTATGGIALGALPALGIQVYKLLTYGSPIYPYQFQFLGMKVGNGVSAKELFFYAGLADESLGSFFTSFVGAWLWPAWWPPGLISDSRCFGGGFILYVALLLLPLFLRTATRREKVLLVGCLVVSLLARDWWLPRWAYTLNVAITLVIGRTLGHLANRLASTVRRSVAARVSTVAAICVLFVHLGRPEFDLWLTRKEIGPRIDVVGSPYFIQGVNVYEALPDVNGRFVIVGTVANGFTLPIYGRRLTNHVLYSVSKDRIGESCSALAAIEQADPSILFIDDADHTKDCARECVVRLPSGWCRAYRML